MGSDRRARGGRPPGRTGARRWLVLLLVGAAVVAGSVTAEASSASSSDPPRLDGIGAALRRTGVDRSTDPAIDGLGDTLDVDVAVLDTGVDASHPDLRVAGGVDCVGRACTAVTPHDPHGHGTHVAGIAAARDDAIGTVGTAPGARVWSVRVLGPSGGGELADVIAGLEWVVEHAATIEVAVASFACVCGSTELDDVLDRAAEAGVVVVVAAGNGGADAADVQPANHPHVIAVASMADYDGRPGSRSSPASCPWTEADEALGGPAPSAPDDSLDTTSNRGAVVDLAAPGVCIRATAPSGGYGHISGTSAAAPHVAGVAAIDILHRGLPADGQRAAAVRDHLVRDASVPADDPCGYGVGPPLLQLAPCVDEPPPRVVIDQPQHGATTAGDVELLAGATAGDGTDLGDTVRWWTAGAGDLGSGARVVATLPDGRHRIVARVVDGWGRPDLDAVVIDVQSPPIVRWFAPDSDASLDDRTLTRFEAAATDAEGRDLSARVTWASDRDGELGVGSTLSVTLSAGTHVVRATVVDDAGTRATVERTLTVAAAPVTVERVSGADRIATAVALSHRRFPDGAASVVLVRAEDFPDALSGGPLAWRLGAPLLLTGATALDDRVAVELERLGPATVHLVGGEAALAPTVAEQLAHRGYRVVRHAGPDRFATAAALARRMYPAGHARAVLVLGEDFPDALGAGTLAGRRGEPLLLTARQQLPDTTVDVLRELGVTHVTIVGGPVAVEQTVVTQLEGLAVTWQRLAGSDRYGTARLVADQLVEPSEPAPALLASGLTFPDGLAAAAAAAVDGAPILLTDPAVLPETTRSWLSERRDALAFVLAVGGERSIGAQVIDEIEAAVTRTPPAS